MARLQVVGGVKPESSMYGFELERLRRAIEKANAVLVGAGAGLSTSAGFTYSGERFQRNFADFAEAYGFADMYSGGFYPFPTPEERWGFWSRNIWCNRYEDAPKDTYDKVRRLVEGKECFAITTNVDHCFQKAGWDKSRLFYTQGVKAMIERQQDRCVPSELVPVCPRCGAPMSMNLRADDTFVEDEGWHAAADRYQAFLEKWAASRILYLELGVGGNTPAIIKYPFWRLTAQNPNATYACVNYGEAIAPAEIADQSIVIDADIDQVLSDLLKEGRAHA